MHCNLPGCNVALTAIVTSMLALDLQEEQGQSIESPQWSHSSLPAGLLVLEVSNEMIVLLKLVLQLLDCYCHSLCACSDDHFYATTANLSIDVMSAGTFLPCVLSSSHMVPDMSSNDTHLLGFRSRLLNSSYVSLQGYQVLAHFFPQIDCRLWLLQLARLDGD